MKTSKQNVVVGGGCSPVVLERLIPDSGKIHQNQEVYSIDGLAATLKATSYKSPPMVMECRK
jgi:hypothetical protein